MNVRKITTGRTANWRFHRHQSSAQVHHVYPHVTTDFSTSANVSKTISDNITCPSCPTCAEVSTVVPEPTTHCPTSEADVDYCADSPCEHGGRLKAFYAFALTGLLVITGPLVCLYNSTKIFNFGLL